MAAGNDNVAFSGAQAQGFKHGCNGDPFIMQGIGKLVEHDDVGVTFDNFSAGGLPAGAGEIAVVLQILGEPGEAGTLGGDLDLHLFEGPDFTPVAGGVLEELKNADLHAASPSAGHEAE